VIGERRDFYGGKQARRVSRAVEGTGTVCWSPGSFSGTESAVVMCGEGEARATSRQLSVATESNPGFYGKRQIRLVTSKLPCMSVCDGLGCLPGRSGTFGSFFVFFGSMIFQIKRVRDLTLVKISS